MAKFEVGDLARLKSGSPMMVVVDPDKEGDSDVAVSWMLDSGKAETDTFPAECLIKEKS